ncbi:hypothetical protein FIBSPDRAFT_892904 [Athelia psychrophila]|uniref:Uncharacterized protein n=1 Tax=Athelia psychrophila TaxID=1759441 RepID=A0A166HWZ8_9AGAM|nr:hypothetical protein FIBSPDRAFT_892904 [Fibularhizoctonia sp. CBS 109695]
MSPHYTRSGRTIRRATSLPPSPRDEAIGATLGEGASDSSDVRGARSVAVAGLVPDREALPTRSANSEDETAPVALAPEVSFGSIDPNDQITGPNEFESPRRTLRAVVLRTVLADRFANTRILFQDWFANQPDENEIKQEEESYDWAGSKDDDPLPDISDMSDRLATGLRAARRENDILKKRMSNISKFREFDNESGSSKSDPESTDSSVSSKSRRSANGNYKRPPRPRLSVYGMRPTEGNNDQADSQGRIHFRDKGKWSAADRGHRPPLGETSGTRAWVSEEQEETQSAHHAQLEYDRALALELQARNDSEYEAESRHLDNQMSYHDQLRKARRKRTSAHALSASARIYSRHEPAGPDNSRPSKHARREGPTDEEQSRDRKNRKLERYRKKIERANLKSAGKAERRVPITARANSPSRRPTLSSRPAARERMPVGSSIHRTIHGRGGGTRPPLPPRPSRDYSSPSSSSSSSSSDEDSDPDQNPFDRAPESDDSRDASTEKNRKKRARQKRKNLLEKLKYQQAFLKVAPPTIYKGEIQASVFNKWVREIQEWTATGLLDTYQCLQACGKFSSDRPILKTIS